ncbi:MAG: riboflavin synthase [Acidobacteriota bacterium]
MFTGLVTELGRIASAPTPSGRGGSRLEIAHRQDLGERLSPGASLAVAGVCLTVTDGEAERSVVELAPETLARTNLGDLQAGSPVNLEPALRVGDALGGHWVQGHVDGCVAVVGRQDLEDHCWLTVALPESLAAYVVEKGSVTLDGVSLTVAALAEDRFSVTLIPHTLEVTTLGATGVGHRLNLEVDVLAKYVERAVAARLPTA